MVGIAHPTRLLIIIHAQKLPRCKAEQGFKRGILCSMLSAEAAATTQQLDIFQREYSKSVYRRKNLLVGITGQAHRLASARGNAYPAALAHPLVHLRVRSSALP